MELLRNASFDVYDFTNPTPDDHGFSWADIDPNWKEWEAKQFVAALQHPLAEQGFDSDMTALRKCDICIMVLPCGRSAHSEMGWAAGAGKKTIVYYPPGVPTQEPELMYKMYDFMCTTPTDLHACVQKIWQITP